MLTLLTMSETHRLILDVAKDALTHGGLAALSMRKVASAVGVSATAIYRHFENKEALVVAVLDEGFALFGQYLEDALRARTPKTRIRKLGVQYVRFGLEHERYYRIMFMTPCDDLKYDALSDHTADEVSPTFQILVDCVQDALDAGTFRPGEAQDIAVTLWGHVHGLVSLYLLGHMNPNIPDDDAFLQFFRASQERFLAGIEV